MPKYILTYLEHYAHSHAPDIDPVPSENARGAIAALGNTLLLSGETLAFFCSAKCPGRLILQTYDMIQRLRQAEWTIVSGFHSPMEQECLTILLRGPAPVIVCPARSIETMRVPREWSSALEAGRLLVISPFGEGQARITAETSLRRNEFVLALANSVFVAHAAPGGKTEALCRQVLKMHKPLITLAGAENANLLDMGAVPIRVDAITEA